MTKKRDETLTTNASVDEALRAGTQALESMGLKVKQKEAGTLEAKGGSTLLCLWIGLLLPVSAIPVKVHYSVTDEGSSRNIQAHIKAGTPLQISFGKFQKRADEVANGLAQTVGSRTSALVM